MSELKQLEEMFRKGQISRREFLVRASVLGLGAALSPAILTSPAQAETPKRGGRLRVGCTGGSTTNSLDPATLNSTMPVFINFQIRNCLVEIDYKGNAIPELAESWEPSPDATKWTFKLRRGVEFHNGKTLSAEDVIYSINYHRGPESKSGAKSILSSIKEIKEDGKYTVVFFLQGGNADFPYIVSDYHLTIFPAGTKGAEFEKGVGTGGYILQSYEPGVKALTKRNPNYWKQGRAHFDEVETISIADSSARTNALKTGQIDVLDRCELRTVNLLKRSPGIKIVRVTSPLHYSIPTRTDVAPFNDNRVRLALKLAVNREQMLKTILRGYGSLGNDHPIGPTYRFHATESELPQRRYDPDKAKYLMKKAGQLDHTFELHAADAAFAGAIDAALLYKESAAKAGIKIKVVREPNDGYWSNVWMKKAWCMCYWAGRVTSDMMFSTAYWEKSNWNDTFWKNKRFNQLLVAARSELDEKKRRAMYVEMQRIVRDEGGVVIPMFADVVEAATTRLKYRNLAGNLELDGQRMSERWWFE
ncbi:MAG: ABC transporter substrate-binding protein [Deltaproteobacteria bacterium]|nr:ABC transporter substrate-binding protein [Deltaproteobacteria bacterium]